MWRGDPLDYALEAAGSLGDALRQSRDPAIARVAQAASEAQIVRDALAPLRNTDGGATYTSPVTSVTSATDDLPQRFAGLAAMLAAGLPLKCVALTSETPFDTHSAQSATLRHRAEARG